MRGWGVGVALAVALAGCPATEKEAEPTPGPSALASGLGAASGSALPEGAGSAGGGAASAPALARGEMPLEAQGPWPSVPPPAAGRAKAAPESFVGLGLKAGMLEAEVKAQLEGINYLVTDPARSTGLEGVPAGEAWAYAESAYAENRHLQSLWLRFQVAGSGRRLRSVQANLRPAEVEAVLGGEVQNVNDTYRRDAWSSMGEAPTALVPQGQDLAAGPGLRLQCPRSEGGEADVAGTLLDGAHRWELPMAQERWTEAGHLAEAFVSEDRRRLALIERLPFSGLRLPRYFQRAEGARAFTPLPFFAP